MAHAQSIPRSRQRRLRPAWAQPDHPIYRLESRRRAASPALRGLQSGCLPLILAAAGLAAGGVAALSLANRPFQGVISVVQNALLGLSIAFILLQALAGGAANILTVAQTTPLISGEIELQSWSLLRATTLSLREIVLAKYAAALSQLRSSLAGLIILRIASTVTGLLFLAYSLRSTLYRDPRALETALQRGTWVMPVVAGLLFLIWYVLQPVVQFFLNGALGLLASSRARSRGRAVVMGLAGRLGTWVAGVVLHVALIYGLIYLLVLNWAQPASAPLRAFRTLAEPSPQQVALVLGSVAALYVLLVAAFQVGVTVGALWLALRGAERAAG